MPSAPYSETIDLFGTILCKPLDFSVMASQAQSLLGKKVYCLDCPNLGIKAWGYDSSNPGKFIVIKGSTARGYFGIRSMNHRQNMRNGKNKFEELLKKLDGNGTLKNP